MEEQRLNAPKPAHEVSNQLHTAILLYENLEELANMLKVRSRVMHLCCDGN